MNEFIRTLVFVVVAAVIALTAYATRPVFQRDPGSVEGLPDGSPLFPDFKDPLTAKSLEIKQFDEATARAASFTVAQQPNGGLVIPSHRGYPADAASHLQAAAGTPSDLTIIRIPDEEKKKQET